MTEIHPRALNPQMFQANNEMTNDEQPPSISQSPIKSSVPEDPNASPNRRLESPAAQRPSKIAKTEQQQHYSDDEQSEEEEEEEKEKSEIMSSNPRLQRYLVAVEYFGTRFAGCQQQRPQLRTVFGVLQEAFQKFIGQPVAVSCSSRTDAGVHALSNVCHVDVERVSKRKPGEVLPPHEPEVVKRAVNHYLQKTEGDIMVIDVRCVPRDFHARHKAQERTYFYRILFGPEPLSILEKNRAWHVLEELNIVAMQNACKILVGHHDFSTFRGSGCQANSPIRTLDELNVTELVPSPYFPSLMENEWNSYGGLDIRACSTKSETDLSHGLTPNLDPARISNGGDIGFGTRRRHRCVVITARAASFLYHQVRLLVGVLKCVGTGELAVSDVEKIMNAKTVLAASPMAPACGLYLAQVKYDFPKDT